ncbi:MAG TPA: hypothetical protein VHO29_07495 [Marmoricola sp.]|nr:hypothetical protein [Marmoricola sp.]
MSDHTDGAPADEPVGSVAEEAAKLFAAFSTWARDQGAGHAGAAGGAAAAMSETMHAVNEHIATGSADCRYCPVCQAIHLVRSTSPEVKAHLAAAASSLMQAAAGMLSTSVTPETKGPVQKIHLDDN